MAVITKEQMIEVSRFLERAGPIDITKTQILTGLQALEDEWESTIRGQLGAALEAALPSELSGAEKKKFGRFFLKQKSEREA